MVPTVSQETDSSTGHRPPKWHPDPRGRYQWRWWNGRRWTEHVANGRTLLKDGTAEPPAYEPGPETPAGPPPPVGWWEGLTNRTQWTMIGAFFAVIAVGITLLVVFVPAAGSGNEPPTTDERYAQVQEVCHNRALDELKAPSSADFGGDEVSGLGPTFTDVGYVDAQNSFGAKIRTYYTCTAIHRGGINYSVRVVLHE